MGSHQVVFSQVKLKPPGVALLVASLLGFTVAITCHAAILVYKKCRQRLAMAESGENERSTEINVVLEQQQPQQQLVVP